MVTTDNPGRTNRNPDDLWGVFILGSTLLLPAVAAAFSVRRSGVGHRLLVTFVGLALSLLAWGLRRAGADMSPVITLAAMAIVLQAGLLVMRYWPNH